MLVDNDFLDLPQFSIAQPEKEEILMDYMRKMHQHHLENSDSYRRVVKTVFNDIKNPDKLADLPFIPVSAFKNHSIYSIPDEDIFKILTSSGTTGLAVSRIYLDRPTARLQTLALSKIVSHVLGTTRLPMLIIDSKSIFSNKSSFSARGAGILGLSVFGKDHTYVLDENFELMEQELKSFLEKYNGKPFFIFGFTFMVWLYLYGAKLKGKYDLSNAILLHSGGWKKLIDQSVNNATFRMALQDKFGLKYIYNFYGMIEQIGTIYLENSEGYLHCPNFADIIIRNPVDFSVQEDGKEGLIQVISVLPTSYPGHSLLTEDIGVIMGRDNSVDGRKGKYFKILGRAKKAELRGCSDTFQSKS
jgi:phenylacetate-coenzyme A ligase PaaK-like adenylate-forming protein